jgi:hypothetical protein
VKALRLEVQHPQVAFRDCQHCREFVYDETSGEPRKIQGNCIPRVATTKPPCETQKGCHKGHWTNPIEVKEYHMRTLRFYEAVRATSGACMTEQQRTDPFLISALVAIDGVVRHAEQVRMSNMVRGAVASTVSAFKGLGV